MKNQTASSAGDRRSLHMVAWVALAVVCLAGAAGAQVSLNPTLVDFGQQSVAGGATTSMSVIFENNSGGPVSFVAPFFQIIGPDAADFALTASPATGSPVADGATAQFDIVFDPSAVGARAASLEVTSSDASMPVLEAALAGEGILVSDLAVTKTASSDVTAVGSTMEFVLTASNFGFDGATGVVVTDTLPSQVTYVSDDCGAGPPSGETLTWNVGALGAGVSVECRVVVSVSASGAFVNSAAITGDNPDPNSSNNTDSVQINNADLSITKTAPAGTFDPTAGSTFAYTIEVTNNGPAVANEVLVSDNLPASVVYVSDTCGGSIAGQLWTWDAGPLAVGESASCELTVEVVGGGTIINTAVVTSIDDLNVLDNSAAAANNQTELTVAKTATDDRLCFGAEFSYLITVENTGAFDATGVVVTDNLPANLTYISDTCGGSIVSPTFTWSVGTLTPGQMASCEVTVRLDVQGVNIPNTAEATADQGLLGAGTLNRDTAVINASGGDYLVSDSGDPDGPSFQFVDISATGATQEFTNSGGFNDDDDGASSVDISVAPFLFYGTEYNGIAMATNGYLSTDVLDAGSDATPDCPLPATPSTPFGTTGARFYALHDDLNLGPASGEGLYEYQTVADRLHISGVQMGAHVLTWAGATEFNSTAPPLQTIDLQTLLYDNGDIVYQYNDDYVITDAPPPAQEVTIGIQSTSPSPVSATTYQCGAAAGGLVLDETAVRFFLPGGSDLSITKTADTAVAVPGELVTYTITVTNHGPGTAADVTVTDLLSSGEVSFVSASCASSSFDAASGLWTWTVGDLSNGAVVSCDLTVLVLRCDLIENTAGVFSRNGDICVANNTDTVRVNVSANLLLDGGFEGGRPNAAWDGASSSLFGSDEPIDDGTVTGGEARNGDWFAAVAALSVTLEQTVVIPASNEVTLKFHLLNRPSGLGMDEQVDVATLAPGDDLVVMIDGDVLFTVVGLDPAFAGAYTPVSVDATAYSDGAAHTVRFVGQGEFTNYFLDDVSLTACPITDVGVTKDDGLMGADGVPGEPITYTVDIFNASAAAAAMVNVSDVIPPEILSPTWTCVASVGSSCENAAGSGDIDETVFLAAFGQVTYTVTGMIDPSARGTITNTASIEVVGSIDSFPDDDIVTIVTTLAPETDLTITKVASQDPVPAGDPLVYTLTVTNNGPSTATNVTAEDTLPAEVVFQSVTVSQGSASAVGSVVSFDIGTLLPGASASAEITVTVDAAASGTITNIAEVTGDEMETFPNDNIVVVVTTVSRGEVEVNPSPVAFGGVDICEGESAPMDAAISNAGSGELTITSVSITGMHAADFAIVADTGETSLLPGEMRIVSITFTPAAVGSREANLTIVSNDPDDPTFDAPITGAGIIPSYVGDQDLSTWTFDDSGAQLNSLGPAFPGDAMVVGSAVPDDDADNSVNDLLITVASDEGVSLLSWYSPPGLIPYSDGCVFIVDYTVTNDAASADALIAPIMRFRWAYGNSGLLGGGVIDAAPDVALPDADGRNYTMMFDQLPVENETDLLDITVGPFAGTQVAENAIMLVWETLDLDTDVGANTVELDSVVINRLDKAALAAAEALEATVNDFTVGSVFSEADPLNWSVEGGVRLAATTAASAVISAEFPNTLPSPVPPENILFGNEVPLAFGGAGLNAIVPSANSGRFYRGEYTFTGAPNTPTQPLPMIWMMMGTYDETLSQKYTQVSYISERNADLVTTTPIDPDLTGVAPPAQPATFSAFLHLPEGSALSAGQLPGEQVGQRVGASMRLVDSADETGGFVTISGLSLYSASEAVLP